MGKINICIVHFNTPELTECLIKSINKFVPECVIYIFDNSDEMPFTYRQENIVYYDNTKGQIINFEEWLEGIKTKVFVPNKHASAKHCYTIQKCMDLIGDNFILLDSDTLLKKDITELYDDSYAYVGDIEKWMGNERVIPYCCFINTKLCQKENISYYNENFIVGLQKNCKYDTGAYFYLSCKEYPNKHIKYTDYVVHMDDGSQNYNEKDKQEKFLSENKMLYLCEEKNSMKNNSEKYLEQLKQHIQKYRLNLNVENPVTIQDKIQWLKIFDTTPLKTKCADKVKVHEYCKEKLGEDICIPILKIYNKTNEINWEELPERFVIKCNHGSGMNIIVKDKKSVNKQAIINKLNKWISTDFAFQNGCELQYHDIERRIFVEKYMEDSQQSDSLYDYKFWCFNGEPKFMTVNDGHGHGKMAFFDIDFKEMNCKRTDFERLDNVKKPNNYDKMVECAKKLSEDFKFVRVDFYEINNKMYLGELTFTPGSGFFKYTDKKYDKLFGDMLDLSNKKVIYTCITGGYEKLVDPFVISPGYDYICFTDSNEIESKIWKIRPIPEKLNDLSNVKKQRCIKINPHIFLPEYDLSVWVDGSIRLKMDINEYIEKTVKDENVYIPSHPQRTCIYEEMNACIKQRKDTEEHINPQKEKYLSEGFPKDYGLVQSNIIIRRHNEPDCIKLMETWWDEVKNGSHRDQLSFDYARWKNEDVKILFLDKKICKSDYFFWDQSHGKGKIKKAIEIGNSEVKNSIDNVKKILDGLRESMEIEKSRPQKRINIQEKIKRIELSEGLKKFISQD